MAKAIVIAAPASGSGKTVVTLGILRALRNRGVRVASAKIGPDYIDPRFHEAATGRPCFNLDPWAMDEVLRACCLAELSRDADMIVIEGVMGLYDGPEGGSASTSDLALSHSLPVVLAVDGSAMGQSVGALVKGFETYSGQARDLAVILNRVASPRHDRLLRSALAPAQPILGSIFRNDALALPSRHLGLVQAAETDRLEEFLHSAAEIIASSIDLDALQKIATPIAAENIGTGAFAPLGQRIAVACDTAFAFCYPHMLHGWRAAGAEIIFFSPLQDEAPPDDADSIFLPGGYPELHAARLAANADFIDGLRRSAERGALVYGECGGFMVLGDYLIDAAGERHAMARLLPLGTSFAKRQLHLGYRALEHDGALPLARRLKGHEFHYSTIDWQGDTEPLFRSSDALGNDLGPVGLRGGNVMGSFAHIIA